MAEKELLVNLSRDFKGIWIPREIWLAEGLAPTEKFLWAEIHSLHDREKGGCYASNDYLMKFMGVKERRLQEMISNLKSYGLVEQVSFDGRERVIRAITPPDGFVACRAEVHYNAPPRCIIMHPSGAVNRTPHVYIDTSLVTSLETPPIPPHPDPFPDDPNPAIAGAAEAAEKIGDVSSKPKKLRTPSEFSPQVKELAGKMIDALHQANPHWLKPKNLYSMLKQIDEMITVQKRSEKDIFEVFMWAVNDHFWMNKLCKPNPAKYLNDQFGQLAGNMNAKPAPKQRKFAPSSNDARALEKMLEWEKGAL
jgi:hypothetical protein